MMYPRNLSKTLINATKESPVVLLLGARQTGKSTLARAVAERLKGFQYVTLDDPDYLAASSNPQTFIDDLPERVVIDEIQRSPEIFLAIKRSVDESRKPGRFILTGSANVLVSPRLSESLAGRMSVLSLWPLSQGEMRHTWDNFVDASFSRNRRLQGPAKQPLDKSPEWRKLCADILAGGFPEAITKKSESARTLWFRSYLKTILERDIRELAQIEGLRSLPLLLRVLATRAGRTINYTDIGRDVGLSKSTVSRYMALFESTYLTLTVPAWFRNLGKRLTKSPKVYFADSGILSNLLSINLDRLANDRGLAGFLLENFVLSELVKQLSWSETGASLYFFRTEDGHEVDFVLEHGDGRLIGIEVKCANSVGKEGFDGLRYLRSLTGKDFHRGIVLYTGRNVISFEKDLHLLPVSTLWNLGARTPLDLFAGH